MSTTKARKAFNRVDTKIQKTQAAIRNVDLDNKVQSDMVGRALRTQRSRIGRNEYALAATKVVDELQEQFPQLKDNQAIKTALPLAPLLFLKPGKKGRGIEGAIRDPRVWGPVLAGGAALFNELRDKDKDDGDNEVQELTVPTGAIDLLVDEEFPIRVSALDRSRRIISPRPTIEFKSSDETKATVNNSGLVTARAEGRALITATATQKDGTKVEADVRVTVTAPPAAPGGPAAPAAPGGPAVPPGGPAAPAAPPGGPVAPPGGGPAVIIV